jgi:hypothetical protein
MQFRAGRKQDGMPQALGFHEKADQVALGNWLHSQKLDSPWSSPVLIVPKRELQNEFRMTVDTSYPNSQLVAIAGCLPILEVILQHMKLASVFAAWMRSRGSGNSYLTLTVTGSSFSWQTFGLLKIFSRAYSESEEGFQRLR